MADTRRLPEPQLTQWDWQLAAACRGMASTTFFHPPDERGPARENRIPPKRSAGPARCSNSAWITPSKPRSRTESGEDCPRTNEPNDSVFNSSDTPPASPPHGTKHLPGQGTSPTKPDAYCQPGLGISGPNTAGLEYGPMPAHRSNCLRCN